MRGATQSDGIEIDDGLVSIHAPMRGATRGDIMVRMNILFQSTPL